MPEKEARLAIGNAREFHCPGMSVNMRTGLDSGHFNNFALIDVVSRVASSEGVFEKKSKTFSKIIFVPSGMSLPVILHA